MGYNREAEQQRDDFVRRLRLHFERAGREALPEPRYHVIEWTSADTYQAMWGRDGDYTLGIMCSDYSAAAGANLYVDGSLIRLIEASGAYTEVLQRYKGGRRGLGFDDAGVSLFARLLHEAIVAGLVPAGAALPPPPPREPKPLVRRRRLVLDVTRETTGGAGRGN